MSAFRYLRGDRHPANALPVTKVMPSAAMPRLAPMLFVPSEGSILVSMKLDPGPDRVYTYTLPTGQLPGLADTSQAGLPITTVLPSSDTATDVPK